MAANAGIREQLRGFLSEQLLPRRHTALLVALVAAFTSRRVIGDVGIAPVVFSVVLMVLMLLSLYTIQVDELVGERETLVAQKKRGSMIGWLLAIPAVLIIGPDPRAFRPSGAGLMIVRLTIPALVLAQLCRFTTISTLGAGVGNFLSQLKRPSTTGIRRIAVKKPGRRSANELARQHPAACSEQSAQLS